MQHAKTMFPHLDCMDDLQKISDLRQPANWFVSFGPFYGAIAVPSVRVVVVVIVVVVVDIDAQAACDSGGMRQ